MDQRKIISILGSLERIGLPMDVREKIFKEVANCPISRLQRRVREFLKEARNGWKVQRCEDCGTWRRHHPVHRRWYKEDACPKSADEDCCWKYTCSSLFTVDGDDVLPEKCNQRCPHGHNNPYAPYWHVCVGYWKDQLIGCRECKVQFVPRCSFFMSDPVEFINRDGVDHVAYEQDTRGFPKASNQLRPVLI